MISKHDLDRAIFRLASNMSDHLPLRGADKGRRAEVHLDMENALRTLMAAVREQARADARAEMRRLLQGFLESGD